ncbi:hypothetical protein ACVIIV_005792 [Bradyrhizobium sp. USDA 4354]
MKAIAVFAGKRWLRRLPSTASLARCLSWIRSVRSGRRARTRDFRRRRGRGMFRGLYIGAVRLHSDVELFRSSDADLARTVAHYHTDAAIVAAPAPTMKHLDQSVLVGN